jgi:N-acyl-L-homoserine lactone synthetase
VVKTAADVILEQDARTESEWGAEVALRAVGSFLGASDQALINSMIDVSRVSPRAAILTLYTTIFARDLERAGITVEQIAERVEETKAKTKPPSLIANVLGVKL